MRSSLDEGATRKIGSTPAASTAASQGPASSGMRSGVITPAPPAAAKSVANLSAPYRATGFQYVMTSAGAPVAATADTVPSTSGARVPAASARSTAAWIVGPSMSGSEYGQPTSTASTPADTIAVIAATAT